jgi:hypothetical protein
MWHQHLFSKRSRNPEGQRVDAFHILTDKIEGVYHFTEEVLARRGQAEHPQIAFIQDCGDKFYIGLDGNVPSVLGKAFPYAYEVIQLRDGIRKGREITFVHGYFADKGRGIPDLDELLEEQPKHLKVILERANLGESPVIAERVSYTRPRKSNTDWDRIATDFENDKYLMSGMTFTFDGKQFLSLGKITKSKPFDHKSTRSPARKESLFTRLLGRFFAII